MLVYKQRRYAASFLRERAFSSHSIFFTVISHRAFFHGFNIRCPVLLTTFTNHLCFQFDEAWDIYMEMRSLNVRPDLFTNNILINACAQKQSVSTALELMDTMRKDKVTPDLVTYNSLVKVSSFALSDFEV